MGSQIHWFPGHMNKALHEIEDKIKMVDVVIEILDARSPLSSINEDLEKVIFNKKKVIILSKIDLADDTQTQKWVSFFKEKAFCLALDLNQPKSQNKIAEAVKILGQEKQDKERLKGMKPQPIKTMIIGIPNVGKSSLINRLAKRSAAGVQNKPGYTRGEQWIKVNNDFILLDTPGILPMNYDNRQKAMNLALLGSIREDILPIEDMAEYLLTYLKDKYPESLQKRFAIDNISATDSLLEIAKKRGAVSSGQLDTNKARLILLKEFKDGLLGKISLEWL